MNHDDYSDIIDMPHHNPAKHVRMSANSRASQFAPFAALTGFDDSIVEEARYTQPAIFLGTDMLSELNTKLSSFAHTAPCLVRITYFEPDVSKAGGEYKEVVGRVADVDYTMRRITLLDGRVMNADRIIRLSVMDGDEWK